MAGFAVNLRLILNTTYVRLVDERTPVIHTIVHRILKELFIYY